MKNEAMTMRAARMYGKQDIRIEDVPIPSPGRGEILLKVKAAAICGTDIRMFRHGVAGVSEDHPLILGHEISGIIDRVGEGVENYRVGQRVAIAPNVGCGVCNACVAGKGHLCETYRALGINMDGGFAEYCLIPESMVRGGNVCLLPETVSFDVGAINEPLSCVCNGFEQADIHPGDRVLVVGAGPIGVMHCALAQMAGAVVYLNDLSVSRLEEAKTILPALKLLKGDIQEALRRETDGSGFDVIITACPVPSVQAMAVELATLEGRVIFFGGVPKDKEPVGLNTNLIHYKQLKVSGTTRASVLQYRKTLAYLSEGVLDVSSLVTKHFPLECIGEALSLAENAVGFKNIIVFE